MPDEWACDECGYIAGSEPDAGRCPGCGAKMTKIEGVDDLVKDDDNNYNEDELAIPIDDDEDLWEDLKDAEEENPDRSKGGK